MSPSVIMGSLEDAMRDRITARPCSWQRKTGRPWLPVRQISLGFTRFGSVFLTLSTTVADAMAQAYVAPYARNNRHDFDEEHPAWHAENRFLPRDAR